MSQARKQAIWEGAKQLLRVALAGVVTNVATSLTNVQPITVRGVLIAAAIAILMGVDKYLHEDPKIPVRGLAPF